MSFGIDVNVLLYASDASSDKHDRAANFLRRCAEADELFCLAWATVMGYLRMATHPKIFASPLTPKQAADNMQVLLDLPHCRVIGEQEGFWDVYCGIASDVPARGNLVPDAHLAAVLRQNGVLRLYTNDRDFRKFKFLDVRDPFA